MIEQTDIIYRKPSLEDGSAIWKLAKESQTLDLNSAYCYIMLCHNFAETCVIAEKGGSIVGFVTAYQKPEQSDTLFVWQIAVSSAERGQGIGLQLLQELMQRLTTHRIRRIETTISPSNQASLHLFQRFSKDLHWKMTEQGSLAPHLFPNETDGHEEETIMVIEKPSIN